VIFRT